MKTHSNPGLFYSDRGTGEPVLLITGWTISSAVFDPVADLYVPHVRVIAYDHRGSGRSGAWPAPVSMAMLAADAARVLDELSIPSAHVVGLSMGAMVALELAVRMPWRVKTLVLVGGAPGGPLSALPSLRVAAGSLAALGIDSIRHRGLWPASMLFSPTFRREHPSRVDELIRPFGTHRAPAWGAGFQTIASSCFSRHGSLGRVRAPTLVIHGTEDVMSPVANAHALAGRIPGATLHLERGAGHAVPLERAQDCAALLTTWVNSHAASGPPASGRIDRLAERVARPFALHAGALRNTRDLLRWTGRRLGRPV